MMRKTKQFGNIQFGVLQRLLIGILGPLLVILILVGILLNKQVATTITNVQNDYLKAESEHAAKEVDSYFERFFGILEATAVAPDVVENVRAWNGEASVGSEQEKNLVHALKSLQNMNPDSIMNVYITNGRTKDVLQASGVLLSSKKFDVSSREWYQRTISEKKTIASGAYEDLNTGELVVTLSTPIMDQGKMTGLLSLDVTVTKLVEQLSKISIGETGYITVFDTADCVLYHPDQQYILKNVSELSYSQEMKQALQNGQDVVDIQYTENGEKYYGTTVFLDNVQYLVLGGMPEQEYLSYILSSQRTTLIYFVLCIVILSVIIVAYARSIIKSLKKLANAAKELSEGHLQVEIGVTSHDEIGMLGQDIQKIVDRLKVYIVYIDEISEVLEEIANGNLVFQLEQTYDGDFEKIKNALIDIQSQLTTTMMGIADSANRVEMNADQVSQGAQAQAHGAAEQASSVEELSANIQQLSHNADENVNHARKINQNLGTMGDEIQNSNVQMGNLLQAIGNIAEKSNEILKIIKAIEDIAFQTNILALNAAVEAARAGEAGKGFAVVADEVRNLAARSAEAAKNTNVLIQDSVNAVQDGYEFAEKTAKALDGATAETSDIVHMVAGMVQSYQDLTEQLNDLSSGVDQIANVVQTNSATAEESAAASQELAGQAELLKKMIAKFKLQ